MKRIFTVWAVAALMAALVLVMTVPAFAAKGGVGKTTQTCDPQQTLGFECSRTTAGKEGNINGGPGRTDATFSFDPSAIFTNNELAGLEGESSGGGGRCEFDNSISGKLKLSTDENAKGKDEGQDAPCPENVVLP